MKKYTKEQLKIIKKCWKQAQKVQDDFYEHIDAINNLMQEKTGIPDLEFFWVDGFMCGVGNYLADKPERYPLLQEDELEGC